MTTSRSTKSGAAAGSTGSCRSRWGSAARPCNRRRRKASTKRGDSEPLAAETKSPPETPSPKPAEVRPIDVGRAELAMFALVLLAAGLAHFHPGLALIAPAVYLLILT